jgi:hypothetical protein
MSDGARYICMGFPTSAFDLASHRSSTASTPRLPDPRPDQVLDPPSISRVDRLGSDLTAPDIVLDTGKARVGPIAPREQVDQGCIDLALGQEVVPGSGE